MLSKLILLFFITVTYALNIKDGAKKILATYPEVLIKQKELNSAKSSKNSSWNLFAPKIDASASYNKVEDYVATSNSGTEFSKTITLKWNLFNGGSDFLEIRSSYNKVESTKQDLLKVQNKAIFSFIKAYIEVSKAQELYLLSLAKFDEYKKLYQKELAKDSAGLSTLSFVSNIRGKFRSTQLETLEKQKNLQDKISALEQFIPNIKKDEKYYFPRLAVSLPKNIDSAIKMLLKNNHDLKKYIYEIKNSKIKYQKNYKQAFPVVDFDVKKIWSDNYYEASEANSDKLYVGISAKINLFNGFGDFNTYKSSLHGYSAKVEERKKTRLELIYKLKLKYNQLKLEDQKDNILRYFIKARYDALVGAGYDFDFGKIDISIFLNSINEFYGAREKYVNHKYDSLLAKYEFFNSIGILKNIVLKNSNIINEEIVLDDERFFQNTIKVKNIILQAGVVYSVKSNNTKVYKKDSKKSKIIKELLIGDDVVGLEAKGNWLRIDMGWINKNNIVPKYLKGQKYISLRDINIRKDATIKADVIGWYSKDSFVFSKDVKKEWIKTNKGWVFGGNLRLILDTKEYYIVNATSLYIRNKPSLKAKIIGRYSDMSEVYPLKEKNGWIMTNKGWINKQFLIKVKDK